MLITAFIIIAYLHRSGHSNTNPMRAECVRYIRSSIFSMLSSNLLFAEESLGLFFSAIGKNENLLFGVLCTVPIFELLKCKYVAKPISCDRASIYLARKSQPNKMTLGILTRNKTIDKMMPKL